MSEPDENRIAGGFAPGDFELLGRLESAEEELAGGVQERADELWERAERLIGELGAALFGEGNQVAALWPDGGDGDRGPFLWARIKRAGNERFATHLGAFLSPGSCNLSIDLEKDPLDAGESAERLEQVLDFYPDGLVSSLRPPLRPDLVVWTDPDNVVAAADFAAVDFDRFMAANADTGHPWPKVGYLLSAADVEELGEGWVEGCRARLAPLVPVYDAMIRSYG
ncbi:MAG TPA: hypothetical protein VGD06_04875 [Acidobacteriota bacterium]|jgi:hypothetical protein